jgi:hypothetical protein
MAFYKKNQIKLQRCQEILAEYDMPITLRQLYYQLVVRQFIANLDKEYRALSRLCVRARDEGSMDEEAFADRLREIDKPASWNDLSDFMSTVKNAYRKNIWDAQDNYVEIWSEKDALRGVLAAVTHRYDCTLLIVRGQLSRTAVWEGYNRFVAALERGKQCHLYYFGDHDPSGIGIYRSLRERLLNYNDGALGPYIKIERVSLSEEQISKYELPSIKAKKEDPNYKRFIDEYSDMAVELDALPPNVLMDMVEDTILSCLDQTKREAALAIGAKENLELQKIIDGIRK